MRLIDADAPIAEYPDDVLTHSDIKAAPTVYLESLQPQWIPVIEKLPEENGKYIIQAKNANSKALIKNSAPIWIYL